MNCPLCQGILNFIEECLYYPFRYSKRGISGKRHECEDCGSEILEKRNGNIEVVNEGVVDLVTKFNQ